MSAKPCPPPKKIICELGATWCGLRYEPGRLLDAFPNAPFFCGMGAGDINGDGCPDLYFADYNFGQTRLFDRLLINQTDGNGKCLGTFKDETDSILGGFSAFTNSPFSTGAQIVDLNGDFCNDILKSRDHRIEVLYNSTDAGGLCTGTFVSIVNLAQGDPYMVAADDVNNDGNKDLYVVRDGDDQYRINLGGGNFSGDIFGGIQVLNSPKVEGVGGNVRLIDVDGDEFRDVLISDVDVEMPECDGQLAILQTVVDPMDPLNATISDPLGSDERPWNTLGTYDTAVFDVNGDGKADLWSGTCSGNRLFIQGGPTFVVVVPPAGTLDARRPHPSNDNSLAARQGIGSGNTYTGGPEPITINLGVTGAALLALWDLCETGIEDVEGTPLDPNSIISVTEVSTEVYEIVLERPISSGHWTTITYLGDCTGSSVVSYASLPADSNADGVANGVDVTDLIDCCISQICTPPHGMIYSCDIDRSGFPGTPDILELIDLLNGLGLFIPWSGVALPNNTCLGSGESSASAPQELATSGGDALSTGALNQQHFADRFVAYVSTGTLADAVTEQDFRLILEALTRWAVDHFSREERETLASRLQDPSLSLENPTAAQMIPDTVAALLK